MIDKGLAPCEKNVRRLHLGFLEITRHKLGALVEQKNFIEIFVTHFIGWK